MNKKKKQYKKYIVVVNDIVEKVFFAHDHAEPKESNYLEIPLDFEINIGDAIEIIDNKVSIKPKEQKASWWKF